MVNFRTTIFGRKREWPFKTLITRIGIVVFCRDTLRDILTSDILPASRELESESESNCVEKPSMGTY